MRPDVKAACIAIGAHWAMYAWWIWADALLSDDYYMFATAPNYTLQAKEMFRPVGAAAADALAAWVQSSPGAVYWAKALSLVMSSSFAGLLAAGIARTTGAASAGVAIALLASTNPGIQINTIWLCTLPIWMTYAATAAMFYMLVACRERSALLRWGATMALCAVMAALLLLYQMAPFLLIGATAAFIVLATGDRWSVGRVVVPAGVIVVVSMVTYLVALWIATTSGFTGSGRASGALSGMLSRLAHVRPQEGLFWFNLLLTAPQSAAAVLLFIVTGASLDIWRNGKERALRWAAAVLLTLAALYVPPALNSFPAARLYSPGAIGVAGLIVASALALYRELPAQFRAGARATAIVAGLFLGVASQAAGVVGLGLNQHAELQHVRNQIAQVDTATLMRVHLIPPPADSAFWLQPIGDPAHDMYIVRLSSYHHWAQEGLVRFALRYLDPARRVQVTIGNEPPEASPGTAIVDMRPADKALFQIPY